MFNSIRNCISRISSIRGSMTSAQNNPAEAAKSQIESKFADIIGTRIRSKEPVANSTEKSEPAQLAEKLKNAAEIATLKGFSDDNNSDENLDTGFSALSTDAKTASSVAKIMEKYGISKQNRREP